MTATSFFTTTSSAALLLLTLSVVAIFHSANIGFGQKGDAAMDTKGNANQDHMPKLPKDVIKYSQVPKQGKVFTATTVPKGLLKQHNTKAGTWGIIRLSKGRLEYKIHASKVSDTDSQIDGTGDEMLVFELTPERSGIIQPTQLHQVKPITDDVEFVVEFLRLPKTGPVDEQREGLDE
mmetsp:Transcript_15374/g.22530  ORF Transcript_15374/g.22530 Transcript_15374/m.22530 type:complete len:178 (+) Transcript_15374:65-598(+)|eukprot:CAMPEP_0197243914 /NCGR_PEP_ID=MMETSP1429-20130617/9207_1 /TAXON_ID=49237 /ORGANISM="Chaetoceros  sp., Strain UNC1202" /LENGTH=177 /DNA_ID=CAMNT_0042704203 /DNA_START=61 /DNA_END=594 /DNA_ORIENTATION=+